MVSPVEEPGRGLRLLECKVELARPQLNSKLRALGWRPTGEIHSHALSE